MIQTNTRACDLDKHLLNTSDVFKASIAIRHRMRKDRFCKKFTCVDDKHCHTSEAQQGLKGDRDAFAALGTVTNWHDSTGMRGPRPTPKYVAQELHLDDCQPLLFSFYS